MHVQNIFEVEELLLEATVKEYLTVRQEGSHQVQRALEYYDLDMIISVDYRVKSHVAPRFRTCGKRDLTPIPLKKVYPKQTPG